MTANKPMTGEQLDELMTVAVNMQRDSEKVNERPAAMFAYAVQVAVLELRKVRDDAAELELKLAESQREFRAADATIENLQMQVERLRTANAGLCAVLTNANACYKAAVFEGLMEALEESSGTNLADIVTRRLLYIPEPITSDVTGAFLAEVRAQGVDAAIEHLHKKFDRTGHIGVPVMALEWLAQELRKGGAA